MRHSIQTLVPVTDLGGEGGAKDALRLKFLHFHAVFGKNWSNNRLTPPSWVGAPVVNLGSATVYHAELCIKILLTMLIYLLQTVF